MENLLGEIQLFKLEVILVLVLLVTKRWVRW